MKQKETPQCAGPETNTTCGKGTKKADCLQKHLPYIKPDISSDRDFVFFQVTNRYGSGMKVISLPLNLIYLPVSAKITTFIADFIINLPMAMDYISVSEFAEKYGIPERTARNYCATGRIDGAFLVGKTWNIPADALLPRRAKLKVTPLLAVLREQKEAKLAGGIYHRTQIDLTYNSNHIEGSRLTHDQTRYIFETNTIGITDQSVNVDDIIETTNHFRCIDLIIDRAQEKVSEALVKELHRILKSGTSDSRKDWFAVGGYKRLPNEVGGRETTPPAEVHKEMKALLKEYNAKKIKTFEDVIDLHQRFEAIHPFQDGNGRVGRLLMFKECLACGFVPFIITDELKMFYYRGLQQWPQVKEYLLDTCLTAQDNYKALLDYFKIRYRSNK